MNNLVFDEKESRTDAMSIGRVMVACGRSLLRRCGVEPKSGHSLVAFDVFFHFHAPFAPASFYGGRKEGPKEHPTFLI